MIFEAFAILCLLCFALALIAELGKKPLFGLIASILLFVGGLYLLTDDLQIKTGEIVNYGGEDQTIGTKNLSGYERDVGSPPDVNITYFENNTINTTTSLGRNETKSYVYSDMPATPYYDFVDLLGLALMLIALGGMGVYAFDMRG